MPMIRIVDVAWHQVTLTQAEIWQCRSGTVLVSREAVTEGDQGLELLRGDSRQYASGTTVNYRRVAPSLNEQTEVVIYREAV